MQATFTGKELDAQESGLQYYGARYLSNETGRFISVDPLTLYLVDRNKLREKTGSSIDTVLSDPQQINSYSYVRNNPLIHIDPNGECIDACVVTVPVTVYVVTTAGIVATTYYVTYYQEATDYLVTTFDTLVEKTSEVVDDVADTFTNWWNRAKDLVQTSSESTGSESKQLEGAPNNFPENPDDFNPKNWKQEKYDKGNVRKWTSPDRKTEYEWNNSKPGQPAHWHKNIRNMRGEPERVPHPDTGNTHIQPGQRVF